MKIKKMPIKITAEAQNATHLIANTGAHDIHFDKSAANGGTEEGPSPIHTFVATLNGCTYVVLGIMAKELGVTVADVKIDTETAFNPAQIMNVANEKPLEEITVRVSMKSNATPEQLEAMKHGVETRCPVAVVMRDAGITIHEEWSVDAL